MKASFTLALLIFSASLLVSLETPAYAAADQANSRVAAVEPQKPAVQRRSPTWNPKRRPVSIPARTVHSTRRELRLRESQKTQFMG